MSSRSRAPSFKGLRPSSKAASAAARGASKKRNTSPELRLRRALSERQLPLREGQPHLPGKPDLVFPRARIAVFCDGDFWHGRDWPARREKLARGSNPEYWIPKIERNMARDAETNERLRSEGWTVLRFWESEIAGELAKVVAAVEHAVSSSPMSELPPIQAYMDPVLSVLAEAGGEADNVSINEAVARRLGLSGEVLAVMHGRGDKRSEFEYRIAWARTKLKSQGKISSAGRGRWKLCHPPEP